MDNRDNNYGGRREEDLPCKTEILRTELDKSLTRREDRERAEEMPVRKKRAALVLPIAFSAFLLFLIFSLIGALGENQREAKENESLQREQSEEVWRGAFLSREVCESCASFSVSIRLGRLGEYAAPAASGVVISSDGWIASSSNIVENAQRGRIYVRFDDGSEYAVEKLRCNFEYGIVFLKIDAEGLSVPTVREEKSLCVGERVVSLSSSGAPEHKQELRYGALAGFDRSAVAEGARRSEGLIATDLDFFDSSMGSPVFDESGKLVGISLWEGSGFLLPAEKIQKIYK